MFRGIEDRVIALTRTEGDAVYRIARRHAGSLEDTELLVCRIWSRVVQEIEASPDGSLDPGRIRDLADEVATSWRPRRRR